MLKDEIKVRIDKIKNGNIPDDYLKSECGVIPGEWEINELGSYIIDMKSGLSRKLSDSDIGIPVIRSNNISNNVMDFSDIKYWYLNDPQGSNTENYFLKDGDILVNFINSLNQIGKAAMFTNKISRNVIFTTNILKMTLDEKLSSKYFLYFTETEKYATYISSITKPAVNQASFTTVEFKKMKLAVPPLSEQQKIAEILTTWNKAIELTEQLIEEKKLQKKGLMKKLLTGEVRLSGFEGEWDVVSFGDIFERITRKNTEVNTNVLTISAQRGLINQEDFFNKSVASAILDNYFLLERGEFAYNKSYSNGYPMGAIKRLNLYESGVVTTLYICFKLCNESLDNATFYEHYFESGLLIEQLTQIAHEGGRAHGLLNVSPKDFFNLRLPRPTIEEQNMLSKLFTTTCMQVELLEKEIDALKQQKKGLLQLLLTGIVRVQC